MKFFKEIKEAYNKRDAYQRDYDSSVAGMGKRQSLAYQLDGGANDEGWDRPQYQAPQETYYIRFKDSGAVYKQKGAPKSFSNKAGANAYALAMIKNNPGLKGNLLLTVDANDKPAESLEEANYDDANFNPRIEIAKIDNLKRELTSATFKRKQEIAKEIKEIENQLRLHKATLPPEQQSAPVEADDGAPYMLYTDVVQAGQYGSKTLQGAKNAVRRAMMQQQAHTYAIATDNQNKIVAVWYPTDHEDNYQVGDTYRPPGTASLDRYDDQPRYPEGHPYAGAVMPPNIPITTDWHAQEERPKQESVSESTEDLPMYGAIIHRIMVAHTDVLAKYGPEKIMSAAEDEAEWVGDVEEIGSSDVSISVKRVIQALEEQHGVKESESSESELERLKLRQNAEHGHASLKRQAETQARIRELEKQIKDKVAEGVDDEGSMAKSQLSGLAKKAQALAMQMSPDKQLDAWVQSLITRAETDITDVHDFLGNSTQSVDEAKENPTDVINVDVPMLLRVMEFAREDAQSDVDLHKVAERLTQLSADGRTVTIDDYNSIVSDMKSSIEEAEMTTGNQGYDNMLAVMKAVDAGQDATFNLNGEPITLEYPEARFLAGKYKAFLRAGRQEEFLKYMNDPVMFDRLMLQLRQLIDKQKNFKGSVPGERGVTGDVPKMESVKPATVKALPTVKEGYYYCQVSKSAKLIPEGYTKTASGYITRK